MPIRHSFLAVLLVIAASVTAAMAHEFEVGSITIGHPWSRATPAVAPSAGGYLRLTNNGTAVDRLVSIVSPLADRVEVHESTVTDGIARMRPLTDGVEIGAGETIELQPGGTHIMFIRPSAPLVEGERFTATLSFETAGDVEVEFVVQGMGARPAEGAHDHGADGQ